MRDPLRSRAVTAFGVGELMDAGSRASASARARRTSRTAATMSRSSATSTSLRLAARRLAQYLGRQAEQLRSAVAARDAHQLGSHSVTISFGLLHRCPGYGQGVFVLGLRSSQAGLGPVDLGDSACLRLLRLAQTFARFSVTWNASASALGCCHWESSVRYLACWRRRR